MSGPVRVLGVDTSLRSTGVGVVESTRGSLRAIQWGVIKNPAKRLHSGCLAFLGTEIRRVIAEAEPVMVAVEGIFYCKNARTAVVLGEARGIVLAACAEANIPVYEYAPRRVKSAVLGYGSATKDQMSKMIRSMLGLPDVPEEDAADALAIAICHLHLNNGPLELAEGQRI